MRDFESLYKELEKYKAEYGDCNVPHRYVTLDGYKLGYKVHYIRSKNGAALSKTEIMMLNNLGFEWQIKNKKRQQRIVPIDIVIHLYEEYIKMYKTIYIRVHYVTADGIKLGQAINSIKNGYRKVTSEERKIFENLGLKFKDNEEQRKAKKSYSINQIIQMVIEYKQKYGDCNIPVSYVTEDGINLGRLFYDIKVGRREISDEQRMLLSNLGVLFGAKHKTNMDDVIALIKRYKAEKGNCKIPIRYITPEGIKLGIICRSIKQEKRKVSNEERAELAQLGFTW